jgi:hypothetical protein
MCSPANWVHDVHVGQDHGLDVLPRQAALVALVVLAAGAAQSTANRDNLTGGHMEDKHEMC